MTTSPNVYKKSVYKDGIKNWHQETPFCAGIEKYNKQRDAFYRVWVKFIALKPHSTITFYSDDTRGAKKQFRSAARGEFNLRNYLKKYDFNISKCKVYDNQRKGENILLVDYANGQFLMENWL